MPFIDGDQFQLIACSTEFGRLTISLLMLMLAQVKGLNSSQYQTLIKRSKAHPKQVKYYDSLLWRICMFVPRAILEVKLRLNFFTLLL